VPEVLFKQVDYNVGILNDKIRLGEIGLPDIQRPFVWSTAKVRDLFDSMYKGFPVGYLLFWENALPNGYRTIGGDHKQNIPRLLIVDGQQRLTSLYAVLKAMPVVREDYTAQRILIAFRPRDQVFEVSDAAIARDREFIPDISAVYSSPSSYSFITKFLKRLREHREVTEEDEALLSEAIDRLYDLRNYPFTALELSSSVDELRVAEVFVRINSSGVTLNQSDFILTLMSVFWDQGRTDLEDFCRACRLPSDGRASPYNHFVKPGPDELLLVDVALGFRRARLRHVYSILRGKDLQTEEFSDARRAEQFAVLEQTQGYVLDVQNWHEFLKSLVLAGFRGQEMILSHVGLMYSYAMFLIGKRDYGVDAATLRSVFARWFFMVSLTSRYSTSPESTMEQDLARLREVSDVQGFVRTLDQVVADALTEDYWSITLPNELATSASRSPALLAYYAALNLLGARVLFSQMKVAELFDPALRARKAAMERHHLFPRAYLASQGITEIRDVNQIANLTLLEWPDNVAVSDTPPFTYVAEVLRKRGISANDYKEMAACHALPDGWERMAYADFLTARRRAMAQVVRRGYEKLKA